MTTLTTTLFLPLLLIGAPRMTGPQTINIVWVSTPRDVWGDTSEARAALLVALSWWEARTDVAFTMAESEMTTDTDVLSLNVCDDHAWLSDPQPLTLYVVAATPTYRALDCDGRPVGDYNESSWAIVWGYLTGDDPVDQATLAHTLAHLYGAADTHTDPGRTYDIMDRDYYVAAYQTGYVADRTWQAIGARPR